LKLNEVNKNIVIITHLITGIQAVVLLRIILCRNFILTNT